MAIETVTGTLLGSVLSRRSPQSFTLIANSRIAEKSTLKASNPNADAELAALVGADLINSAPNGEKYASLEESVGHWYVRMAAGNLSPSAVEPDAG
jgi:hypothetical protein